MIQLDKYDYSTNSKGRLNAIKWLCIRLFKIRTSPILVIFRIEYLLLNTCVGMTTIVEPFLYVKYILLYGQLIMTSPKKVNNRRRL